MEGLSPEFDSIKQTNVYGADYWSARALMPLLGYKRWDRFVESIKEAIESLKNVEQVPANHIVSETINGNHISATGKKVRLGSGAEREIEDYFLSRIGCYLIAINGDPRKPEISAAQNYFAISTRRNEIDRLRRDQEERLEARLKVSESYKQLARAAQNAGVQSERFGIFVDAGYLGLHRHTRQELKERKNIPEDEEYLDCIGRQELSAIDFKNTHTEGKLIEEKIQGEDKAVETHYFVGDQIRETIKKIKGPMPEDLPTAPSIRKLIEERNRANKKRTLKADGERQQNYTQNALF